ncbi:hypothetical protein FGO68_gene4470 [Halteria grandinella]|uniref:Uncharacterized protein n=1 Tax=Halteria grandinella TaxID=5974 RepID=A0A8J8NR10_HALGN|nr:hypothetical protein FGO68_gene4470 [Halteria grandinella]
MKHSSKTHRNLSDVEGSLFKLKKMRPADRQLPVTAQSLLLDPHIIEVDLSQNPSAKNQRQPKTTRNKPKTPYLTGEKPYQTNASSATGVSMLQQNVWMMPPPPQFDPYYHSPISTIYSREEYVYKQQLGEFVKDIKNNGPEGVLNSARKQALTPSNRPSSSSLQPEQVKEMALIIKFKDEQIFELRRQLQLLNTHKDRVLQECQLLKTREDTHKAQIRELQDMLERQMKQKDEVHNKYIKEQEYALQLRQENHSLKMAIRETSKERDKVINETSVYQLPHARMSISRVNQNALTQIRSGENKLLQQSTISSSNTFFKASQTSSVLIPSFVIPHKHSPISKPTQHKMMMVNKPRDPGYYEGETQQAHEDSGVGAIIPSSSGWIPTSANHNRFIGENPSFHSSPQQKQPFNMKTVKKGISESLTYRNPSSIKQSQTPAESLTGSGRRGHYKNADFVNRNLLSQVPQILAWHGDAIEDGID